MGFFSKLFRRGKSSGGADGKPPSNGSNNSSSRIKGGKGRGGRNFRSSNNSKTPTDRESPTEQMGHPGGSSSDHHHRRHQHQNHDDPKKGGGGTGGAHHVGGSRGRPGRGPDLSEGSQGVPLSQRNPNNLINGAVDDSAALQWKQQQRSAGPIDLDQSMSGTDNAGSSTSPELEKQHRLATQQLEELDQNRLPPTSSGGEPPQPHSPKQQQQQQVFTMADDSNIRFSAGLLQLPGQPNDDNMSDNESSSFNLSTDAEDTDYENLRRRGVLPPLDTSTLSSNCYNTDGEHTIFPNLHTDDDQTMTTATSDRGTLGGNDRHSRLGGGGGGGGPPRSSFLSLPKPAASNDSSDNDHALATWPNNLNNPPTGVGAASSSSTSATPKLGNHNNTSFPPYGGGGGGGAGGGGSHGVQQGLAINASHSVSTMTTASNNSSALTATTTAPQQPSGAAAQQPRRNFTSPKKKPQPADFDDFANFADFNNISFPSDPAWNAAAAPPAGAAAAAATGGGNSQGGSPKQQHSKHLEMSPSSPLPSNSHRNGISGSNSLNSPQQNRQLVSSQSNPSTTDTSLSELLAQAKSKSARSRRSNTSVSSAPATSAYLLSRRSGDRYSGGGGGYTGNHHEGTSVTDIIESLEAANASRGRAVAGGGSHNLTLNNSMNSGHGNRHRRNMSGEFDSVSLHSRDNASVRSAKERLRRRRAEQQRHHHRGPSDSSDSSDDDDRESENWLRDELTGALGPRGIAPDLESLSGRSNRSRGSGGGRSHKSHKSHRSHRSHSNRHSSSKSRRHKSSSGDSVSSHGSRRSHSSRRSRNSRYSHRSTRSYLSQMSEQSRSVANDLLRLEMQLAMVGSSPNNAAAAAAAAEAASVGSRHSYHHHGHRSSRSHYSSGSRHYSRNSARRTRITVLAPPGKLGIILANKADSKGTVVSGVRTSSPMTEKISPGDRIVAIDGEDVSLMTVSEITTIMARKADFERTLTVLTTPRTNVANDDPPPRTIGGPATQQQQQQQPGGPPQATGIASPISSVGGGGDFDYRYHN